MAYFICRFDLCFAEQLSFVKIKSNNFQNLSKFHETNTPALFINVSFFVILSILE